MKEAHRHLLEQAAGDARRVARLLQSRTGERQWRRRARAVLVRAFSLVEPEAEPEADQGAANDAGGISNEELAALLRELEQVRAGLGDLAERSIRPLRLVRIQRPFPQHPTTGRSAALAMALSSAIDRRCAVDLTFDEERLAWFEARCQAADPGMLRPIVASGGKDSGQRLLGSELELIRKRRPGQSS